jgi:MFS family permease
MVWFAKWWDAGDTARDAVMPAVVVQRRPGSTTPAVISEVDAETGLTPAQRTRSLIAIIASCFGVGITFGMGYPLAALTFESWGEAKWVTGLVGAAPSLAIFLLLPFLPGFATKVNPVRAIGFGCLVSALGYLGLYLLEDPVSWIALRFLMGAGVALPWLIGETWINSVTPEHTRTRIIAIYAISFFAGFAAGPAILDVTGITGPLPFVAGASGSVLAVIPIIWARNDAPDLSEEAASGLWRAIWIAPASMAAAFLGGFLETIYFSLMPNAAVSVGVSESAALQLMTILLVGGLAMQFAIGWLGDLMSRLKLLVFLGVVFMLLTAMLPWVITEPAWCRVLMFLTGGVLIGFYTLGLTLLGEQAAPGDLAAANAAFIMMYTGGSMVGPAVAGVAMTASPILGFVASAVIAAYVLTALIASAPRGASGTGASGV